MDNTSRLKNFLRHIKHWIVVKTTPRKNRVYTQFLRFPHQYRALVEKVIPAIEHNDDKPIRILMFACCSGAEPISLSYILKKNFPQLRYEILAYDIVEEAIDRAKNPSYRPEEICQGPFVTEEFIDGTFDKIGENYRVKPEIMQSISFDVGDMLDLDFISSLGKADLVFAQNVLFHLPAADARRAFSYLNTLLKPGATLFVNGMDMDMRIKMTKKFSLAPVDYLIEEIHNDARVDLGSAWAGAYWGRKPFSRSSKEWIRQHCTIYSKARA